MLPKDFVVVFLEDTHFFSSIVSGKQRTGSYIIIITYFINRKIFEVNCVQLKVEIPLKFNFYSIKGLPQPRLSNTSMLSVYFQPNLSFVSALSYIFDIFPQTPSVV